jgi:hypothetical protein
MSAVLGLHCRFARARIALVALAATVVALAAAPALASAGGAHWQLETESVPTSLKPGETAAQVRVVALNLGDADAAPPITITDRLPAGLVAERAVLHEGDFVQALAQKCSALSREASCTWTETPAENELPPRVLIPPFGRLELVISVKVEVGAKTGELNEAQVQGANTPSVAHTQAITVSSAPVQFGVERYEVRPENEDGSLATQAGAHPFQLTTTLNFNTDAKAGEAGSPERTPLAPALPKNLKFDMPPGLVADASAVPQCSSVQFTTLILNNPKGGVNSCPADTAIGVVSVGLFVPTFGYQTKEVPLFNLEPGPDEPARFGFEASKVPVFLDTSVRTGENYGAVVTVAANTTVAEVATTSVTVWGVPGDSQHNNSRGWECIDAGFYEEESGVFLKPCRETEGAPSKAFLTLPTVCGGAASATETTVSGEAWPTTENHEGLVFERRSLFDAANLPALTGCEKLQFEPEMKLKPTTSAASSPTGLDVTVKVPQTGILAPKGLAEADVKETTTALPEGVLANAGAANGLTACSPTGSESFGFNGFDVGLSEPAQLENDHFEPGAASCPNSSEVGTVTIKTPLLPNSLEGFVYLARQDTNPFNSPLVLYLTAQDPVSGVRVKLAGEVKINESNGQLVTVFKNTPAQPFEELNLKFFEGERGAQTTPAFCKEYETKASFVSWAGGEETQSPKFSIGPGPSGCPGSTLPFSPSFQAGTSVSQADAFTPFTLTIGRPDGHQALKTVAMQLPPGQAAMISSVKQCPEPGAGQEWSCGSESLIGHSTAVSGLGGKPVVLGGNVYFAGPYKDAPFSVVDITKAEAGPFNLGNIAVRSTITVDPNTAAATITSDPIPQFVKGAPSQIKELNVTVDRPNFEFNPTNCAPMKVEGTLTGYEGASNPVSSPFQVANCAQLPFAPDFSASTSAHTSKTDGASLNVRITYPKGSYANVAKSITELPYALPSRLTTIQKACPDTVFEANPAMCGEGSNIGHAIVYTPVFKNPLVGPAYLVSHGNRAFPDIEIVLQGEGIKLVLDGHTDIKNSITKTTFESVPDAPVEVFELILPEGPHSALAANDNLCKPEKPGVVTKKLTEHVHGRTIHVTKKVKGMVAEELVIPTKLVAQNGRVLEQRTKIAVSGCSGVKGSKAKKKPAKKAKKSGKKK